MFSDTRLEREGYGDTSSVKERHCQLSSRISISSVPQEMLLLDQACPGASLSSGSQYPRLRNWTRKGTECFCLQLPAAQAVTWQSCSFLSDTLIEQPLPLDSSAHLCAPSRLTGGGGWGGEAGKDGVEEWEGWVRRKEGSITRRTYGHECAWMRNWAPSSGKQNQPQGYPT